MGRLACQAALQVTTLRILPSTIALADLLEDCSFHYSAYVFSCIVKCCMLPSTLLGCAGLAAFASQPLHAMHASCLDNFRCCTEGEVVGGEVGVQILAGSRKSISKQQQPVAAATHTISTWGIWRLRPLKQPRSSALVT